jgi:hypothetical protein
VQYGSRMLFQILDACILNFRQAKVHLHFLAGLCVLIVARWSCASDLLRRRELVEDALEVRIGVAGLRGGSTCSFGQ